MYLVGYYVLAGKSMKLLDNLYIVVKEILHQALKTQICYDTN